MNNNNNIDINTNPTEPCPCCGSHLMMTHAVGCPRGHVQWFYANGMQMSQRNALLLNELKLLVKQKI